MKSQCGKEERQGIEEIQDKGERQRIEDRQEMKKRGKAEKWKRYLSTEIGIEYKACIYFFAVLFFYSMYLLVHKVYAASLLHMAEIIGTAYGMGYLQVLALGNFDEAESFGRRELLLSFFCSALYAGISYLGGWFDRSLTATALFALYCVILYLSAYLANRVKRSIDTEQLNVMLQAYKRERRIPAADKQESKTVTARNQK